MAPSTPGDRRRSGKTSMVPARVLEDYFPIGGNWYVSVSSLFIVNPVNLFLGFRLFSRVASHALADTHYFGT